MSEPAGPCPPTPIGDRKHDLAVLVLFVGLSVLLTYPTVLGVWHTLPADLGDPLTHCYFVSWGAHCLRSAPLEFFHANFFHPYPYTLAYAEHFFGVTVLLLPIIVATGNVVFAYNIAFLASFVLSGFGTYLLASYLSGSKGAGVLAGLVFAFCGYRFAHLMHLDLLTTQWMPLCLLYTHRFCECRSAKHALLMTLFFLLTALSCWYYAFYLSFALAALLLVGVRAGKLLRDRAFWRGMLLFAVLSTITLTPFVVPYYQVRRQMPDFGRPIWSVAGFSADPLDYLRPSPKNWLYRPLVRPRRDYAEHALFPGLVPIVLAGCAVLMVRRAARDQRRWILCYAALGLFAALMSFGPFLRVPGRPASVRSPYFYLYCWLPGFSSMRVPSRFVVLMMLAAACLSAFAGAALARRLRGGRGFLRSAAAMLSLLSVLCVLENVNLPTARARVPLTADDLAVHRAIAQQGGDSAVLVLNAELIDGGTTFTPPFVYASTVHWRRLVNGYSGYTPQGYRDLMEQLRHFPSEETLQLLKALAVRYVVTRQEGFTRQGYLVFLKRCVQQSSQLRLVGCFGRAPTEQRLWEIVLDPPTPSPELTKVQFRHPTSVPAAQETNLSVELSRDERSPPQTFGATSRAQLRVQWRQGSQTTLTETLEAAMPLFIAAGKSRRLPFCATTPALEGKHQVQFVLEFPGASRPVRETVAINVTRGLAVSAAPAEMAAEYVDWQFPSQVVAGRRFPAIVALRNAGDTLWLARSSDVLSRGKVEIRPPRWLPSVGPPIGEERLLDDANRGELPFDVSPSQTVEVGMTLWAPTQPGSYRLVTRLAHVGFPSPWSTELVVNVEVRDAVALH